MNGKKGRRRSLDPDDVIAGRSRPEARDLIALIRDVNPTGRGLPPSVTAARYAKKSRLQSALIARFRDEIEVHPKADEPGVVSLVHRPTGLDACHALIAELDIDARSWVQSCVDIGSSVADAPREANTKPAAPARVAPARMTTAVTTLNPTGARPAPGDGAAPEDPGGRLPADHAIQDLSAILAAGKEAALAYDFDLARERFQAALARSGGHAEPAEALLSLLVDHLAADDEALALEERLSGDALSDPAVRVLLALAAARQRDRERALRLLDDRGGARRSGQGAARKTEPQRARAAEVFVTLARGAIDAGRLDEAAEDLARAREREPTRPEIIRLSDALAKQRAREREPAERELGRLLAAGDIAGAAQAARELLARWPDSEAGRRAARVIDEHRRREQADEALASAKRALSDGERNTGIVLLRQALARGLRGEDAAWAERRIAAIEDEARLSEEQARHEEIRRMILAGDRARGLPRYAALSAQGRQAVRGPQGERVLCWLDVLVPPGAPANAKAAAAIHAIMALDRAADSAAREPSAALDALAAHSKTLEGFEPAAEVVREARLALSSQRRAAARRGVEAARRALDEGKLDRADESLREAPLAELPEDERAAADALSTEVRRLLARQVLATSIEQLQRDREELRALGELDQLLALADDAEKPRLEATRAELRAEVQRRFCVTVEDRSGHAEQELDGQGPIPVALDPLWDTEIDPREVCRMLFLAPSPDDPGGGALVIAQTKLEWVFLRVIDVASMSIRARVTLRTPAAVDLIAASLSGRRLVLLGGRSALLEISLDTFHIERWCPSVLRNGDAFNRPVYADPECSMMNYSEEFMDDGRFAADGRSLWLNTLVHVGGVGRRAVRVVDRELLRPIRELHEPRGQLRVRPVFGLKAPRMLAIQDDDNITRLYDPRGLLCGDPLIGLPIEPDAVTAHMDGESVVLIASDPAGPHDPFTVAWGWIEVVRGVPSPFRVIEGITAVYCATSITSLDEGMVFVLFEMQDKGGELVGLREGKDRLEIAFRAQLPRRSMLLGDPSSRRAAVLLSRRERAEIVRLSDAPPAVSDVVRGGRFHLPSLPMQSTHTTAFECRKPAGARLAAATALCSTLRRENPSTLARRIKLTRRRGSADELRVLEDALFMLGQIANASLVNATAWDRFADNPKVRLNAVRALLNFGRWSEARDVLLGVDPKGLNKSEVKHWHHLLGICFMMLDEPETALDELRKSEACEEGTCKPGDLIAICAPPGDTTRSWTSEQAVTRELMATVAAADAALERGDGALARCALDGPLVWEAYEVQSLGRLAEAYLLEEAAGGAPDRFKMALALLSFCELFERRETLKRREMVLPRVGWKKERLASLAAKARERAEAMLQGVSIRLRPPSDTGCD